MNEQVCGFLSVGLKEQLITVSIHYQRIVFFNSFLLAMVFPEINTLQNKHHKKII